MASPASSLESSAIAAPPCALPAVDQHRWFKEEVQPHAPLLRAHLRNAFPGVRDVDDVVQESFLRVWQAKAARPVHSAKAFLFRVGRNLCLDVMRRARRLPIADAESLEFVAADVAPDTEQLSTEAKLQLLTDAVSQLPPRCREIFLLCHFQGCTRQEAADQLRVSHRTVDEQIYRAYRRIEASLRSQGVDSSR